VGFFSLILGGMITGNMLLIYLGLIPAIHVIISIYLRQPAEYWVDVDEGEINLMVGGEITLTRKLTVDGGLGPVIVGENLPKEFELLEGNNIRAFWKGMRPLAREYEYRIRCTRRGYYELENFHLESRHPQRITSTILDTLPLNQKLVVKPLRLGVKKIQHQKLYSYIPMPLEARIKMGVPTTDFKEIREYNFGDPYKHINWKATARLITTRRSPPAVNEYEKEGRRVVWLFLNCEGKMELGTSIDNVFEYGVKAVQGLSEFYINRQCMVGFAVYNNKSEADVNGMSFNRVEEMGDNKIGISRNYGKSGRVILPDTGRIQGYRVQQSLINLETAQRASNLKNTITQCRAYIKGTNPLFIIITHLTGSDRSHLQEGIKELQKYVKKTRRVEGNIIILNISGYQLSARGESQYMASKLLDFRDKRRFHSLGRTGVQVIHWNPSEHNLLQVFMSQAAGR
jgi:hypothetical protein